MQPHVCDDDIGEVENLRRDLHDTQLLMTTPYRIHHRVSSMEVKIGVVVQRATARNSFSVATLLDLNICNRGVIQLACVVETENPTFRDGRQSRDQGDVVKLGNVVSIHVINCPAGGPNLRGPMPGSIVVLEQTLAIEPTQSTWETRSLPEGVEHSEKSIVTY